MMDDYLIQKVCLCLKVEVFHRHLRRDNFLSGYFDSYIVYIYLYAL